MKRTITKRPPFGWHDSIKTANCPPPLPEKIINEPEFAEGWAEDLSTPLIVFSKKYEKDWIRVKVVKILKFSDE